MIVRSSGGIGAAIVAAIVVATSALAGCGGGSSSAATPPTSGSSARSSSSVSTTSGAPSTTSGPGGTTTVSVFLIRGEKVGPVRRTASGATPARSAVTELLAGPTAADTASGLTTAIPAGTTLRSLAVASGTATVDLSSTFGSGGGSTSMQERVAEVVYTLTQFPTVQRVTFRMDGAPVTALGGEGLVLTAPQTRADWEASTPAILVESPLPGDPVTSPVTVSGTADTFEATFRVAVLDPSGAQLADQMVIATSGSGTRGTFSTTVPFTAPHHGTGTLRVYEVSMKDGSHTNVVSIPVRI